MKDEAKFIIAGCKPWNRRIFEESAAELQGTWHYIGAPHELDLESIRAIEPRYIFFLHWSEKVPSEIFSAYECICFHMTDLPYGRGGSPLQNLIIRGHSHTKMTAIRMVEAFDAGPVYFKEDLCLEGNAEEIYIRATHLCMSMIARIAKEKPCPTEQCGAAMIFRRRKPQESLIPSSSTLKETYDFIRMLDAEGYPHAFLNHGNLRLEFRKALLYDGRVEAQVCIRLLKEEIS